MHERSIFRPDIQGLRAIAVVSVVLFHIWPEVVPGGFIGVDIFFVISGYLITGMLFRELQASGRISLLGFYERRIRRLLPAATLVLLAITLAIQLLPEARWRETAIEIAASALYVENWHLAYLSVDYLGSENAASPVQHYWSLSIEEQFYIVWPILMMAAVPLSRATTLRTAILVPLSLVIVGSLAASIWLTSSSPENAYFVTHARVWELGIGALVAIAPLPDFSPRMRSAMRLGGLGTVILCSLIYSTATSFPGYAALLPTLACALVIAAGADVKSWSSKALAIRPAQYLGDISYSMYLWHWPLVVFFKVYWPETNAWLLGLSILCTSVAAASLTKRYVEDPFRRSGNPYSLRTIAYGAASIAACVAASVAVYAITWQTPAIAASSKEYPGSAVLFKEVDVPTVEAPIPSLVTLKADLPEAYAQDCHVPAKSADPNPCHLGRKDGEFHIILVGDSHAANWIPALDEAAKNRNWRLTTHTKSGCSLLKEMLTVRGKPYEACKKWGEEVLKTLLADPPDLLLFTQSIGQDIYGLNDAGENRKRMVAAIESLWTDLRDAGIDVVAIRDTPRLPFEPGECLAKDAECAAAVQEDRVFRSPDPIVLASREMGVPLIDMTDAICTQTECPVVVGNVIVWRDSHHLTASYSRTMADPMAKRIDDAISRISAETNSY